MDGTILSSIAAAERVWARWAARHGLDMAAFLPTIHGMRSVETVRRLNLPGVDPVVEAARITREEMDDVAGIESTHAHPLATRHAVARDYATLGASIDHDGALRLVARKD